MAVQKNIKTLAKRIIAARALRNLSTQELSEIVNVPVDLLRQFEKAKAIFPEHGYEAVLILVYIRLNIYQHYQIDLSNSSLSQMEQSAISTCKKMVEIHHLRGNPSHYQSIIHSIFSRLRSMKFVRFCL